VKASKQRYNDRRRERGGEYLTAMIDSRAPSDWNVLAYTEEIRDATFEQFEGCWIALVLDILTFSRRSPVEVDLLLKAVRAKYRAHLDELGHPIQLSPESRVTTEAPPVRLRVKAPHPAQTLVLDEAARFNVIACGRRWGKTEGLLEHVAVPSALDGNPVGWFAPTYKLLDEAWHMACELLAPFGASVQVSKQERQIRLPSGGVIDFWTLASSTAETSRAGRGRKYADVIIDEAAHAPYLEQDWTKAIRPTLADLRGRAWFPSTPYGHNYFWRLWTKGQAEDPLWASWQMPTITNPYIHPDEIEAARADLPADAFAKEYEAQFLADAANPFGVNAIRACIVDPWSPSGSDVSFWGVDLAKSTDWTVAIGLDDYGQVKAFQRWQGPWRQTMPTLCSMIGDRPCLMDSTGVGDPIVEMIQSKVPLVEGYKFTSQSKQQLMEGLAVVIQRGEVGFPDGLIVNELESFQYEYKPTGVRYTAPEGMHDDCVDALALAVRCRAMSPGPAVLHVGGEGDAEDRGWLVDALDREELWT
jgi:hypothetical protein